MSQSHRNTHHTRHRALRLAPALASALVFGLLALVTSASAAYEQVGCFAGTEPDPCKLVAEKNFGEEVQLGGVGGMAVNRTGEGGVPEGTVYAATKSQGEGTRIAMYEPKAGGLGFVEGWNVSGLEAEYERCGPSGELPDGESVHPNCAQQPEEGAGLVDVDVDQATGNVFAYGSFSAAGFKQIVEYSADGGEEITRFGELAPFSPLSQTVAESPGKIHESNYSGGIAVNGSGEVYVFDFNNFGDYYRRLMVFGPQNPGDYKHYEYKGEVAANSGVGAGSHPLPAAPVTDAAGNIFVSGENYIDEYAPETPSSYPAPPASPVCHFEYPKSGITSLTVNPANGEVFFFSYKPPKRVHRLGPCDEETGEFSETEAFTVSPERDDLYGLAFDPNRQLPSRPPGVLYGGAPAPVPGSRVGKGQPGQSSLGYVFSRAKEVSPSVEAESISHVGTTTAKLQARINSKGSETHYAFQYITETAYEEAGESFVGAKEAPLGGGTLVAVQEGVGVDTAVSGLLPDTAYRYRALATSHCSAEEPEKACEGAGPAQSFHTFPAEAPGLPDNRAWELVSPPSKHGGQVLPADPGTGSCGEDICKPGINYSHFPVQSTPDGNAIVYEGTPFSPSEGAIQENEYVSRRDAKVGWQTTNLTPPLLVSIGGILGYKAFDTSLQTGLIEQLTPSLSPEAPSEYSNLYLQPTAVPLALGPLLRSEPPNRLPGAADADLRLRYAGASANLSRVFFEANDALTPETAFAPEAVDGGANKNNLYEWAAGQLRLVNVLPGNTETEPGAAFGAGSAHAISTDGSRAFWSDEAGQAYVRTDGETTRAIPDPGKFLSASADGSKMLLSNGHIYDLESEATTDLSQGEGGFQGIVGQSEDLSRVYFVDTAVLDEAPNGHGEVALPTKNNLYAWHKGAVRYVATLAAGDNGGGGRGAPSDWSAAPSSRTAEASPGGRFVAFVSRQPLSGYDNTGPCKSNNEGGFVSGPCAEAFVYDSAGDELTCASCNRSGERPLGGSVLRLIFGTPPSLSQPRYLTDEGRLLFDSQDSLSPFDTNEGIEDVYEYEPSGVGACDRQGGCVALISAGHEAVDSNFLAIDETGENVFFTSRDTLVLKDEDDLIDLYDAREGGGIPGETEAAPVPCQGEACQPPLSPPNDPTPGSSSFEGAGNVVEPKQTNRHKRKRAKKHKSKKHAHKRAAKHNRGGAK
jgi:hypothetical protein